MGQFEKIVVLTVLFLITVILVVSLSGGPEDEVLAREGVLGDAALEAPAGEVAAPPLTARGGEERPSPEAERSSALPLSFEPLRDPAAAGTRGELAPADEAGEENPLGEAEAARNRGERPRTVGSVAIGSEAADAEASARPRGGEELLLETAISDPARDAAIPGGSLLRTLEGLEPSPVPELMFHLVQPGETWSGLARRYYGDASRVDLLRQANEDRELLVAGEEIFVPVFDIPGASPSRPAAAPTAERAGARTYVVREGDSLWKIAKEHYGKGSRFMEIFEANRDVLDDVDATLVPGTRLRIPRD